MLEYALERYGTNLFLYGFGFLSIWLLWLWLLCFDDRAILHDQSYPVLLETSIRYDSCKIRLRISVAKVLYNYKKFFILRSCARFWFWGYIQFFINNILKISNFYAKNKQTLFYFRLKASRKSIFKIWRFFCDGFLIWWWLISFFFLDLFHLFLRDVLFSWWNFLIIQHKIFCIIKEKN